MELGLRGKRALITGASKGIGLGIAQALAAEGVDLLLAARSGDALDSIATDLTHRHGVRIEVAAVDLARPDAQVALAERATAQRLDILVNNAGAIPAGSITDIDDETWRAAWDLKVFGYINLMRLLLPHLEASHAEAGGSDASVLLNVIGAAADHPNPGYIAGAAGNTALAAMSRAIGSRSMRTGVRVLAVNPGLIITDRLTDMARQHAMAKYGDDTKWEEFVPSDPPPGTVEQVADVVAFLVSPRASHVSGTTLTIDGGASAR